MDISHPTRTLVGTPLVGRKWQGGSRSSDEAEGSFERFPYPDARQLERLFRTQLLRQILASGLISQEIPGRGLEQHADYLERLRPKLVRAILAKRAY